MSGTVGIGVLLVVLSFVGAATYETSTQGTASESSSHDREYWRQIAKNRFAVLPGGDVFALARELSGYLGSPDPELRDDLAYSILAVWIVRQKQLTLKELLTLTEEWEGNLRGGIGETETESVLRRSFSALCLELVAERDLKDPFLGGARYRKLLEEALTYLRDERDLRGFDAKKGWIHATAHTADLLAALAENLLFTKEDQPRVLEAIAQRLATASEIFAYGEQDRLANVAAAIIARKDFDPEGWNAWVAKMHREDSMVWQDAPPKMQALTRFENDSYFLRGVVAQLSLRGNSPASTEAQKTVLDLLRSR